MVRQYSFTLPWPPSANRYWRHVGSRVIVSKEARIYKSTLKELSLFWKFEQIREPFDISILVYPPDNRLRDLDNLLKVTIDALNATGLFLNDAQITSIFIEKLHVIKPGSLEVTVMPRIGDPQSFLDKIH